MYKSIKEYADEKGVTARAVHKQINNHPEELEGHVITREGKKWLDEEAIRILNEASKKSPVVYVEETKARYVEDLEEKYNYIRNENELLKAKVIQLQDEKIEFIGLQEKQKLLLAQRDELNDRIETLDSMLQESNTELGSTRVKLQNTTSELKETKDKLISTEEEIQALKNRNLFQRIFNR